MPPLVAMQMIKAPEECTDQGIDSSSALSFAPIAFTNHRLHRIRKAIHTVRDHHQESSSKLHLRQQRHRQMIAPWKVMKAETSLVSTKNEEKYLGLVLRNRLNIIKYRFLKQLTT